MPDYTNNDGEEVKPLSAFYSTNLSPRVDSFDKLATRIAYTLGYPLVNVEVHTNNIYDNIAISCEMFAKFAGYTEEYLIFDSALYEYGKGIRMDILFSMTPELSACYDLSKRELREKCKTGETTTDTTSGEETCTTTEVSGVSATELSGVSASELPGLSADYLYVDAISADIDGLWTVGLTGSTITSTVSCITGDATSTETDDQTTVVDDATTLRDTVLGYDYDINDYRKVIDVWSFQQGSHTGVNTLFTLEQSLAQQTYFSYSMSNYGFDLTSWYVLKEWLETREKLLAIKQSISFDERTQYLKLTPEPANQMRFYGAVACYVERPVRDLVKELWVYQYATALTKIVVGRVRGKYGSTNLMGGGNLDGEALLSEGNEEKKELETKLYEGTPGFGDAPPPSFFVA